MLDLSNAPLNSNKFSQGALLRYAGVHMREQRFWNMPLNTFWSYTTQHILVKVQNSPTKQGFCLKFDPLNRFESKEFE